MRKSDFLFNAMLVPIDFAMIVFAGFAAYFLRLSPMISEWRPVSFNLPIFYYTTLTVVLSALFILIFAVSGLYNIRSRYAGLEKFFQIVVAISAGMMLIIIFMFFKREWFDSRFIMLAAWFFGIIFVTAGRIYATKLRKFLTSKYGLGMERVVIVGNGERGNAIKNEIKNNPYLGYEILGEVDGIDIQKIKELVKNSGAAPAGGQAERIILADSGAHRDSIIDLVNFCEDERISFQFMPDLFDSMSANFDIDILGGNPLIDLKRTNLEGWGVVLKRIVDIAGAIIMLPAALPIFLLIAALIKWESKGPIFVKLKRVSRGKEFYLLKFRSMIDRAEQYKPLLAIHNEREDGPLFKMKDDPRTTRVGRLIRSKRIDELPQIFNVIRGDISLVGPRPHEPQEVARYERHHKKVLAIKSGITGMAQISGAEKLPFEEEVKLDRYYIEHWSLWRDFLILLKTLGILLFGKTEY